MRKLMNSKKRFIALILAMVLLAAIPLMTASAVEVEDCGRNHTGTNNMVLELTTHYPKAQSYCYKEYWGCDVMSCSAARTLSFNHVIGFWAGPLHGTDKLCTLFAYSCAHCSYLSPYNEICYCY